jgi:Myb-like DNA-binding domain
MAYRPPGTHERFAYNATPMYRQPSDEQHQPSPAMFQHTEQQNQHQHQHQQHYYPQQQNHGHNLHQQQLNQPLLQHQPILYPSLQHQGQLPLQMQVHSQPALSPAMHQTILPPTLLGAPQQNPQYLQSSGRSTIPRPPQGHLALPVALQNGGPGSSAAGDTRQNSPPTGCGRWSPDEVALFDKIVQRIPTVAGQLPKDMDVARYVSQHMGGCRTVKQCAKRIFALRAASGKVVVPLPVAYDHQLALDHPSVFRAPHQRQPANQFQPQLPAQELEGWAALKEHNGQVHPQLHRDAVQRRQVSGQHHPNHDAHQCWQLDDVTAVASQAMAISALANDVTVAASALSAVLQPPISSIVPGPVAPSPTTNPALNSASASAPSPIPTSNSALAASFSPSLHSSLTTGGEHGRNHVSATAGYVNPSTGIDVLKQTKNIPNASTPKHAPDWNTVAILAQRHLDTWIRPTGSSQAETNVFHLCKAILKIPGMRQMFMSQHSKVSMATLSQYVRYLFKGNQSSIDNRLLAFVKRFTDGDFDSFLPQNYTTPPPVSFGGPRTIMGPPNEGLWVPHVRVVQPGMAARSAANVPTVTATASAAVNSFSSGVVVPAGAGTLGANVTPAVAAMAGVASAHAGGVHVPSGSFGVATALRPAPAHATGSTSDCGVPSTPLATIPDMSGVVVVDDDSIAPPSHDNREPSSSTKRTGRRSSGTRPPVNPSSSSKRPRRSSAAKDLTFSPRRGRRDSSASVSIDDLVGSDTYSGRWTEDEEKRLLDGMAKFTTGRTKMKNKRVNMSALAEYVGTRSVAQIRKRITNHLRKLQVANDLRAMRAADRRLLRQAQEREGTV